MQPGGEDKEPCPFDPASERGATCEHGERCPYYVRRGKEVVCLGSVSHDGYLGHLVAAGVLLRGE